MYSTNSVRRLALRLAQVLLIPLMVSGSALASTNVTGTWSSLDGRWKWYLVQQGSGVSGTTTDGSASGSFDGQTLNLREVVNSSTYIDYRMSLSSDGKYMTGTYWMYSSGTLTGSGSLMRHLLSLILTGTWSSPDGQWKWSLVQQGSSVSGTTTSGTASGSFDGQTLNLREVVNSSTYVDYRMTLSSNGVQMTGTYWTYSSGTLVDSGSLVRYRTSP